MNARRVMSAVLGVVLSASALVGLQAAPASAAVCAPGKGVTVVVDFTAIPNAGKGVETACVPDGGGKKASEIVTAAGFVMRMAQRFPGFVCRINDLPSTDPCVMASPASAFWGLYWSAGKDGSWQFSSTGVGGLTVPEGGSVGWSFQGANGSGPPRITAPGSDLPVVVEPSPEPQPGSVAPVTVPTPKAQPTVVATPKAELRLPAKVQRHRLVTVQAVNLTPGTRVVTRFRGHVVRRGTAAADGTYRTRFRARSPKGLRFVSVSTPESGLLRGKIRVVRR